MTDSSTPSLNKINYLNVVAFAINILCTYIVGNGALPGSQSNPELSAKYQTLITPAGWAFAIWGVIFTSQALFTLAQLLPPFRAHKLVQEEGIGMSYVFVCLAQSVWGIVFAYELIELSVVCMFAILFFLVKLVLCQDQVQDVTSVRDFWLLKFPFSLHCGWIVAASFVNVSLLLVRLDAGAGMQYYAALGSLGNVLAVAAFALWKKEYTIPMVLSWATIGIYSELGAPTELITSTFDRPTIAFVRIAAGLASLVILIGVIVKSIVDFVRNRSRSNDAERAYLRLGDDTNDTTTA